MKQIIRALQRARIPILTVAVTYLLSIAVGMLMVHTDSYFALAYRDRVVSGARASPSITALGGNRRVEAAVFDFGGNLVSVASSTVGGLGVIFPYPLIAYRGWIGGIVSVDGAHASRLAEPREAAYYLSTLLLQVIPSVLAGGAGVALGLSLYRPKPYHAGKKWIGISVEALKDVGRIYLLVIPLLILASLWEFLLR